MQFRLGVYIFKMKQHTKIMEEIFELGLEIYFKITY